MLDPLREVISPEEEDGAAGSSVFTTQESAEEDSTQERRVPDTFEELPIEIRSLTER
jgi:hypothetical protein